MEVTVDGSKSDSMDVKYGVPEGPVMVPLLFLLFLSDLHQVVDPGTQFWGEPLGMKFNASEVFTVSNRINLSPNFTS